MIPYGRQDITEDDIAAVLETLRSDFLTQGPRVPAFETALCALTGAAEAVALANGTAALHLAAIAFDLGPGSLLWTSPITFVASANCARYCGADVDFVDIDPATANMSIEALASKLDAADRAGRLPDVVVPVHFAGQSCDMAAIGGLAERYGFRVLEDASHAVGATYRGASVGSCAHSDAAVFSFHPVKIVTTGEGGALLTNDSALAERVRTLRTHGITRDPAQMTCQTEGAWYYEQRELGFNYRMTDLQAALGASQLPRVEAYVARRNELAERYDRAFESLPVSPLAQLEGRSAYHLYVVTLDDDAPVDRAAAFSRLQAAGIGVNVHYIPVHLQPYYRALGFAEGDFPASEAYYRSAITLPLFPTMTDEQHATVVAALTEALS